MVLHVGCVLMIENYREKVSFVLCIDVVFVVLHIVDAKGGQILQIMERFLFVVSVGLFVEVMI